ncbi:MAG: serine hydrolase domain-containing protein, partial [Caulobacteraceae bacterium]
NLYLPESLRIADQGFERPIRVRDLMNHTPGFEDRALGQLFERDPKRVRPLETWLRQERPRRVRAAGTLVGYSNFGAALAGEAVAEVTGTPFEVLAAQDITGPLAMTRTSFREPRPARRGLPAPLSAVLSGDLSQGYRWTSEGLRSRSFEYAGQAAPALAASSTAGDMARFMLMLLGNGTLDGAAIYGPATSAAFSTPQPAPVGVPAWRHGLREMPLPGGVFGLGHQGRTLTFSSSMVLAPAARLGVFVATNTSTGGPLADTLAGRIVGRFYAPPPGPPHPGDNRLVGDRRAFDGVYLTDRRAWGGLEAFVDRLAGEARVSVTPEGRLAVANDGETRRYAPDGPPSAGRFFDEDGVHRLVFQFRRGRAMRFFSPSGDLAFERIGPLRERRTLLILTVLTALASLAAVADVAARARRDFRESSSQHRAGLIQTTQAVLWILAIGLFAVWAMNAGDPAAVMYRWPGWPLIVASACALVAGLMAVFTPILLPLVWRGGRRVDSWTGARKARFTLTALLFLAYAALLFTWGGLEPWSA